ncbi:hypothetical protein RF11_16145 [Thelohanellus kitauei]|uniref:Uncharacterized protein n=1 Tax=Thelohanellus kitauei TaxID=669202 RepID=A0A0C2JMP0_THEKT|nr:hypothetical protein RF11_16145 [Thelohanellus kitauei]
MEILLHIADKINDERCKSILQYSGPYTILTDESEDSNYLQSQPWHSYLRNTDNSFLVKDSKSGFDDTITEMDSRTHFGRNPYSMGMDPYVFDIYDGSSNTNDTYSRSDDYYSYRTVNGDYSDDSQSIDHIYMEA